MTVSELIDKLWYGTQSNAELKILIEGKSYCISDLKILTERNIVKLIVNLEGLNND